MNVFIMHDRPRREALPALAVTYQLSQFVALEDLATVIYQDDPRCVWGGDFSTCERSVGLRADAVIVFDERELLTNPRIRGTRFDGDALFVYISHDFWCHPLRVIDDLNRRPRVLAVLRHLSALRLFDVAGATFPRIVLRPGVNLEIFERSAAAYEFDVILGGSETPDYPMRRRVNDVVRRNASRHGWRVCDMASVGLGSNPLGGQAAYAAMLRRSKVSPTGSNRGGGDGCSLVVQYLDHSPARAAMNDPFYGLSVPELRSIRLDTAGITPRYLESMAAGSLVIADIPSGDRQSWYEDKMIEVSPSMRDEEIEAVLEQWIRDDAGRQMIVERAWSAVVETESSVAKARELVATLATYR